MRTRLVTCLILLLASGLLVSGAENECSFLNNPDEFLMSTERLHMTRSDLSQYLQGYLYNASSAASTVDPRAIPHKNFIDESIFTRMLMAGIPSAPLASDAEFLRRVTLDLTGRIPSAEDVDAFLADTNPTKRDLRVDALIGSPEFNDKWTMFFGDLFKLNANSQFVNRDILGRDAFYLYLKDAISANKPYDRIARELITAMGDSFEQGETNWPVGNIVTGGPQQDIYDNHAVNATSMLLGINSVDCLLCHDGPRHLDTVNLWGSKETRQNMWGLSAFFARTRMARTVVATEPRQIAKYIVTEAANGEYQLNTTTGNRSARQPINGAATAAPRYPFSTAGGSAIVAGENRRQAVARMITGDIQFSRAAVNYIWEKFMVEAFVSPSNAFDLARLDPSNPPEGWPLQPTNPELLNALAVWFQQSGYNLRALMALIAKSSAYQLSAVYPGNWNVAYVPYYARKYVRRLDAEEIHDAVQKATGILGNYTFNQSGSNLPAVQWAMQFPDSREPRSNGAVAGFLNAFGRGDRDTTFRRSEGSILQALNMLNNAFIQNRIHQANNGSRVRALLAQNASAEGIIHSLHMNTLSRPPTPNEVEYFTPIFQQQGNRIAAENLQWVLLNKMDFLFNY
jgi:hypothetical protein